MRGRLTFIIVPYICGRSMGRNIWCCCRGAVIGCRCCKTAAYKGRHDLQLGQVLQASRVMITSRVRLRPSHKLRHDHVITHFVLELRLRLCLPTVMNLGRPQAPLNVAQVTSKFVGIYSKLFQGISPRQISPEEDQERLFSDLLDLKVDRTYLERELEKLSKEACLGRMKAVRSFHLMPTQTKPCTEHLVALAECPFSSLPQTYSFCKL